MKFGLFGSAQAKRGGPDLDSGQGFRDWVDYVVEAEALGYNSIFVVEHHFTGFGQVSASLNLLTWVAARTKTLRLGTAVIVLPWHNPVLLAEQAATIDLLSGGRLDFGVGKGYRHAEFASFCIPQEEADERFEEGLELDRQVVDLRAALLASRQVLALREHHRRAADGAEAASADLDGGGQPGFDPQGGAPRRQAAARPACLDGARPSSVSTSTRPRSRSCGRRFDPMDVGVSRAFFVAKNAEEKAKAIETRFANQQRLVKADASPGGQKSTASLLSFDQTLDAAGDSALFGTPDEIAAKLEMLRAAGIEHLLLNGPTGSRENLRAFARDVMPAFAGPARRRRQPQTAAARDLVVHKPVPRPSAASRR